MKRFYSPGVRHFLRLSMHSLGTLITLPALSSALHAETVQSCPPDHREHGAKPPAGTEWQCLDQNGQVDGPWLTWYDNGQLMSERHMKHGKEHGRQRSWWPNGQLMMEGVSYEGNRYKGFKYWSIDGQPTELNVQTETINKTLDGGTPSATSEKTPRSSPSPK